MIDEKIITRAIVEGYTEKLLSHLEIDVAVCGAGPSGLVAAYYLAKNGLKVAIFERKLSIGGGMWGGGMMFNEIVVQDEGKMILDEFGIRTRKYGGYYLSDAVECVTGLAFNAIKAGARIFNLVSVEDVVIRQEKVAGVVINWTAVEMASLHVDPLTILARFTVDATGHPIEVVKVLERKMNVQLNTPSGRIEGENQCGQMLLKRHLIENTQEFFQDFL
jgi:thiamine thiazole synthase